MSSVNVGAKVSSDSQKEHKMQFVLVGFIEEKGCRVFTFEGVGSDRSRTSFVVKADLALSRTFGIRLQELPLLCREVLEQSEEQESRRTFTYTEEQMRSRAALCATRLLAAQAAKPHRKVPTENLGAAWRAPGAARP